MAYYNEHCGSIDIDEKRTTALIRPSPHIEQMCVYVYVERTASIDHTY